jgi:hypothetical protein
MNYKSLEQKIIKSYTEGVTLDEAEKLAGEFLEAQIKTSEEIKKLDLNARLIKATLKEQKAKLFVTEATKNEKKPSDTLLNAMVDSDGAINEIQQAFDESEVERDEIFRLFAIFKDAHLHFRAISRGKFE